MTAQGSARLSYPSRGVTIVPAEALSVSVQVGKEAHSCLYTHVRLYYDPVINTQTGKVALLLSFDTFNENKSAY